MRTRTICKTIDVDVEFEIEDIDTDDLIDELESRGLIVGDEKIADDQDLLALYELRRCNDIRFDEEFAEYIYERLGRIL